jgi:hypothetical protein
VLFGFRPVNLSTIVLLLDATGGAGQLPRTWAEKHFAARRNVFTAPESLSYRLLRCPAASCNAQKTRANRASELRISKGNTVLIQSHTRITHHS